MILIICQYFLTFVEVYKFNIVVKCKSLLHNGVQVSICHFLLPFCGNDCHTMTKPVSQVMRITRAVFPSPKKEEDQVNSNTVISKPKGEPKRKIVTVTTTSSGKVLLGRGGRGGWGV